MLTWARAVREGLGGFIETNQEEIKILDSEGSGLGASVSRR